MPDTPSPFDRGLDAIAMVAMTLCAFLMVMLIVIFSWLVYGRYILNATPTWVEQVSLLAVVWITFIGAAVGIRRNSHLAVEFVRDALPGPLRSAAIFFAMAALVFFGIIMCWQGYVMYQSTVNRDIPLLGISEGWRAVPVVISGALIAVFSLDNIYKLVTGKTVDLKEA